MNITMTYQLETNSLPHTIELRPEEYFDPLEPEETYENDGVPAYQNAFEYIGCTPDDLKWAITNLGWNSIHDGACHRTGRE